MAQFILFYVDGPGSPPPDFSEQEFQKVVGEYVAWGEKLRAEGRMRGGARLTNVYEDPGRVCAGSGSKFLATDGPLAETKEVVGGYCVIEAASYDDVVGLCRSHPHLRHGKIVIRQLA
jgi:hypothetical protein